MTRTIALSGALCGALCALLLFTPSRAMAHPGHDHTVMGTVKSIKDGHVAVEAKDGTISTFMIADTTKILRGREKATAADIKVGERIVAIAAAPPGAAGSSGHAAGGHDPAAMLVAKEIRLGAAAKPTGSD